MDLSQLEVGPVDKHKMNASSRSMMWYGEVFDADDFDEMDKRFGMTNGRKIARFLSRFSCYDPNQGGKTNVVDDSKLPEEDDALIGSKDEERPSLDAAWAYFEHITLPRRFVTVEGEHIERAVDNIKALPGESSRPTKLYSPFWTKASELGDFGMAIGVYFSTLRALVVIFLITAAIHIPNFQYFSSTDYTSNGQADVATLLTGSAICTDTQWVPCPNCTRNPNVDFLEELWTSGRIVESSTDTGEPLYFALKNTCGTGDYLYNRGLISWVGMIFMVFALLALGEYQRRMEVHFDERNATATDFSITVDNPPGDAKDAEEWKKFLESVVARKLTKEAKDNKESGGKATAIRPRDKHVTCVTVALSNHELLDILLQKRALKKKILSLMGGVNPDNFDQLYEEACAGKATVSTDKKFQKSAKLLESLNGRIAELTRKEYKAKRIFASFETEIGQRAALSALSVGSRHIRKNNVAALSDVDYAFRGEKVLRAYEPTEPPTVRWQDIGVSGSIKRTRRALTFLLTVLVILAAFLLVRWIWKAYGAEHTSLAIAILNMLMPRVCRYIAFLEIHSSEDKKQRSLNFKTLAFRWINTAIVIHLVTPFPWSLARGDNLIKGVCAIFIAEMWTAPLFQCLNIPGNIKRHLIAPRKKDQESMNMCFNGGRCELAERYTNMMKILFLCFFFSALFPGAFVLSAASLLLHYFVDRFCLTRVWAPMPMIGSHVAQFNRTTVIPVLLVVLSVMNAYIWSGFPYDNICESSHSVPDEYTANTGNFTVENDDLAYDPCNQDFLGQYIFPALPQFESDRWMLQGQMDIVTLHAWTSVVVIGITVIYTLFKSEVTAGIAGYFVPTYEPSGEIYGTDFSDVPGEIFPAYVPQVKTKGFAHPLVACHVQDVPKRFIGWRDPRDDNADYVEHNLIYEVPESVRNGENMVFSVIRHWPPPPAEKETKVLI